MRLAPSSTRMCLAVCVFALAACGDDPEPPVPPEEAPDFQAVSFLGDTLSANPSDGAREVQEPLLREAQEALALDSDDPEAWIWVGRRQGYLQEYRAAIATYTEAMERFPDDPRLYRHRGHRYLSIREPDLAIQDFERAAQLIAGTEDQVEPDGLPNERGIPTSTLHFNIWYHLGLAHHLEGDHEAALEAYENCLAVSGNPDALVATSYWMYMTLMHMGREEDALALLEPINSQMDIIENGAYRDLLLLFKGELDVDDVVPEDGDSLTSATTLYGVANWHRFQGRDADAEAVLSELLDMDGQWSSFGYLAAEADAARGP